jgi:hypothetical protein
MRLKQIRLQIPNIGQYINDIRKEINGTGANYLPLIVNSLMDPPPPKVEVELSAPQLPDITLNIPGDNYALKDLLPLVRGASAPPLQTGSLKPCCQSGAALCRPPAPPPTRPCSLGPPAPNPPPSLTPPCLPQVDMSNVKVPGPIDISKIAPGVNLHPNMTNLSNKLAASLKPNITLPTLPQLPKPNVTLPKLTKPNVQLPKLTKPNVQLPKVPNLGLNKAGNGPTIDLTKLPIDKKTLSALLSAAQHQG